MSDLTYAPPPFLNADGQKVIFVDFTHAKYRLLFDATAQEARVYSEITFQTDAKGFPVISVNQVVHSACLDGRAIKIARSVFPRRNGIVSDPFKNASHRGIHVLTLTSDLTNRGPYGYPNTWLSDPARVDCVFDMSDLRNREGGFLESFLPSNLNFDHFRMSFSVTLHNSSASHAIFSNGAVSHLSQGRWKVEFPSFFTSCCPWFHLAPVADYQSKNAKFRSRDGRIIPIVVYTKTSKKVQNLLNIFVQDTKKILSDLESDFGPFPHSSVTILAQGKGKGGMEYAGATSTGLKSLRHELDHSYFARSVIPANGDAGWIDEAIAKWADKGYPRSKTPPVRPVNMSGRSPYIRTTGPEAYSIGRDFLAYLDYLLRKRGGLKKFLAVYAEKKRHQSITAIEFQDLVEDFYGGSLQQFFEAYVYS